MMSMLKKFLNKTALVSGLVAMSLITIPYADAAPKRAKGKASVSNDNSRVFNRGKRLVRPSTVRRTGVRPNRSNRVATAPARNTARVTTRNTPRVSQVGRGGNRANRVVTRGNRALRNVRPARTVYNNNSRNVRYNTRPNRRVTYRNPRRGYYRNGSFYTGLVGGALLYSALNSNSYYNSSFGINYNYGYPYNNGYGYSSYSYNAPYYGANYRYAPKTEVVYVDRPMVQQVPAYQQQPVDPAYPAAAQQQDQNCLQSREYTTTIEIGGESVPAYGQACLQPDGSWKFGDPVAVPSF
ncbi:MAG: hypothetical protein HOJ34_00090 [Kordiimonadaceae bacterium]|nr:hypothetical protein [Kordiimonadaceae bacterium]MBT6035832.1 hypothetical protein [Kordiimonadaceae bacterium]MBT6328153.1 hypothetical protein [Kordiimonadaceae bacterium]